MFPAAQAHPLQELQVASNPSNEKQCFFETRAHTFRRVFLAHGNVGTGSLRMVLAARHLDRRIHRPVES